MSVLHSFFYHALFAMVVVLITASISISSHAQNASITDGTHKVDAYDNDITTTGLAYIEYFYEEPGYGDMPASDPIVGACLFKLDQKMQMANGQSFATLHLLFSSENKMKCSDLLGKRARISGRLGEIHTAHHHGDALLDVKHYEILR